MALMRRRDRRALAIATRRTEMIRSRPKLLKFFAILFSLILTVLILEAGSFAVLALQYGGLASARERFRQDTNTYTARLTRSTNCTYIDTLFPHPYLAFVHHGNSPCGIPNINNIGLFGRNYPSEKPPDKFVILLTGGSVAAQFAEFHKDKPSYLEQILNRDYVSPNGGAFQILNGGDGAWKQPQQMILFMLYSDTVDGVVTLDGFNEHYMIGVGRRFEYPANSFISVNPMATGDFDTIARNWFWGGIHRYASQNAVLSRSNTIYLILKVLGPTVRGEVRAADARRTSVDSLFALPADWEPSKRIEWSQKQYKKYIMAMESVARDSGLLSAYFIQPVPAIGKPLTEKEKTVTGDLSYGKMYQDMADSLLTLRSRRVLIYSLLDTFHDSRQTLYGDAIHMLHGTDGESAGYRMMAEEMARVLAQAWHLKRR
jgi:hypothetical protein